MRPELRVEVREDIRRGVLDDVSRHSSRAELPVCPSGRQTSCTRRLSLPKFEVAGREIFIPHADVDVGADRIIHAQDRLPCKGAVLVIDELDLCPAGAKAGLEGKAVVVTEVDQAVNHEGEGADIVVNVEVRVDQVEVREVVDRIEQRRYRPKSRPAWRASSRPRPRGGTRRSRIRHRCRYCIPSWN